MPENMLSRVVQFLHRKRPWYTLPGLLAAPRLIEIRNELREKNLHDTEEPALEEYKGAVDPAVRNARTVDGTWNDLRYPRMGCAGARFGRNFPLDQTRPDTAQLLVPNPRAVSRELLTRDSFQPATILNLMAASWIQFMVHDWFVHIVAKQDKPIEIPLDGNDSWHERPMRVQPTEVDPPRVENSTRPPAYINENSHWWDGSQLYGCTASSAAKIREGVDGRIRVESNGCLPLDPDTGLEVTGFTDNGWIGLSMLHGLFALEHNAICARLKGEHPDWSDDQIFGKARLINSALLAKIHTVEWTPAILPHPIIKVAMNAIWSGLASQELQEIFQSLNDNELLGGIIGSKPDHHSAPYSLTEEFVSVYRMHPLLPDEFTFRAAKDGRVLANRELPQISGRQGRDFLRESSLTDLFYSFGVSHPGAIRLHNYPRHLQNLVRDDGERLDVATLDILRDRERGVPRYNQFRRLLDKDPVKSFEELTDNPQWAAELRRVYNNDLEQVDVMVGLLAEPLPEGFGFSETAFRVFLLMASRRLKSDRFFTSDYTPQMYTQTGLNWVRDNSMLTVLKRHFPGLEPALRGVENAFHPWRQIA